MPALDVVLRRVFQRIRNALPGHTTASRLKPDPSVWRNAPPQQRASAYVQYHQTLEQLRQIHIQQKLAPKLVDLLFAIICSELGAFIGFIALIGLIALLVSP